MNRSAPILESGKFTKLSGLFAEDRPAGTQTPRDQFQYQRLGGKSTTVTGKGIDPGYRKRSQRRNLM